MYRALGLLLESNPMAPHIQTLGELRTQSGAQSRTVKEEVRENLVRKLKAGEASAHHVSMREWLDGRA